MTLIIGLGNPGREYEGTRHNAGFEAVDLLAADNGVVFGKKPKRRAIIGEGTIANRPCVILKPQTYMNLSGECLLENVRYYNVTPADIIVVYDDCSLSCGLVRVRVKGSAGGHNGVKNIIWHLDTDEFPRVKIGIGEKPERWVLKDYVLSRFSADEREAVGEGIEKAAKAAADIVGNGADHAMNGFNVKQANIK